MIAKWTSPGPPPRRRARTDIRTDTIRAEIASQTIHSRPLADLWPRRRRGPVGRLLRAWRWGR